LKQSFFFVFYRARAEVHPIPMPTSRDTRDSFMCYYARRNATVSSIVAVIDPVDHPGQHIGLISIFCLSMLL